MAFFKKAAKPAYIEPLSEPVVESKQAAVIAQPPVLNPSSEDQLIFGEYRCDAIAREIEQRRHEKRNLHPEHDTMLGEAMAYAWLQYGRKWKLDEIKKFQQRLFG